MVVASSVVAALASFAITENMDMNIDSAIFVASVAAVVFAVVVAVVAAAIIVVVVTNWVVASDNH